MKALLLVGSVLAALVLAACEPSVEDGKSLSRAKVAGHTFMPSPNSGRFVCAQGSLYVAQASEQQAAIFVHGQLYLMRQLPSASGVKLASLDEQAGLRWYSKGQTGFLRYLAPDHTAKEKPVFTDCKLAR